MTGSHTQTGKSFPLFFGSSIALGCFLGMLGATGGLLFSSLGVLANPLAEEFGWSRGEIFFGVSCLTVGMVLGILTTGPLIDRKGPRKVLLVSIVLSILVVALAPVYVTSLTLFYLMIFVGSFVGGPTNTVAYARVIASWFDKRRGLFIGINASAIGAGFALVPLLTDRVIGLGGWQAGYYLLAAIMLLVVLPAVFFLVVDRPEQIGMLPDGAEHQEAEQSSGTTTPGMSLAQAMRTRAFLLLLILAPSLAFALYGTFSQLVPMMGDRAVDASTAALVASTAGMSMAVARLVVGFFLDHFFAPRLAMLLFSLSLVGVMLFLFGSHISHYFMGAILVGFGMGAEGDVVAYLVSRYFGMKNFASIFGCVFSAYMLGTGFGPAVFGFAFDTYGNYTNILVFSSILLVLCISLFAFFVPYDSYLDKSKT